MNSPINVAITGAAGQIGYALVFRVASGAMFGPKQPVALHLIEIPPAIDALKGVVMELDDCAFPLLKNVVATTDCDEQCEVDSARSLVCDDASGSESRQGTARTESRCGHLRRHEHDYLGEPFRHTISRCLQRKDQRSLRCRSDRRRVMAKRNIYP